MRIGCFALIEPFATMRRQFELIREMGFDAADLTDCHDGACLGNEFGFSPSISLESHPARIRGMLGDTGIELTAVCAHANLLDPPGPDVFATSQIIKALQLAHFLGVGQVITTEGDPHTPFGQNLTDDQRLFAICERLVQPIAWARQLGVRLLIETHGVVTDRIDKTRELLDALDADETVGLNLDTGNLWLGGGDPVAYVEVFGPRIEHVHWKDMPESWEPRRGELHGCGMATIPLGEGVVGIDRVVDALKANGFDGPTTLEIAGVEPVQTSARRLRRWWDA